MPDHDKPKPIRTGDRTMMPHSEAIAKLLAPTPAVPITEIRPQPFEIRAQTVASLIMAKGWRMTSDFIVRNDSVLLAFSKDGKGVNITVSKEMLDDQTPEQIVEGLKGL